MKTKKHYKVNNASIKSTVLNTQVLFNTSFCKRLLRAQVSHTKIRLLLSLRPFINVLTTVEQIGALLSWHEYFKAVAKVKGFKGTLKVKNLSTLPDSMIIDIAVFNQVNIFHLEVITKDQIAA